MNVQLFSENFTAARMAPEVKLSHPAKLKDMYTALVGLSETDCESSVKAGLLDMLDRWTEQRGFTLAKYNSEYVALLLKLLHSDTPDVSKQVFGIITKLRSCKYL